MIHELLHTIGFFHRGSQDGLMIPDTNHWYSWCTDSILDSDAPQVCSFDSTHINKMPYF